VPRELTEEEVQSFRDRFCESFTKLYAEKGYAAVTMRALAEDVGCSPMTPYRYFRDKDEIFASTRAAGFKDLFDRMDQAIQSVSNPIERARVSCETYLDFARQFPDTYRLMYNDLQWARGVYPELDAQIDRARNTLADMARVVPGVRESTMKPAAVAQAYWAALHGAIQIQLAGGFDESTSFEEIIAVLLTVLTVGGQVLFEKSSN
jgi:AcrR family transcriptional regulator